MVPVCSVAVPEVSATGSSCTGIHKVVVTPLTLVTCFDVLDLPRENFV